MDEPVTPDEAKRQQELREMALVALHATVASIIVWITMPLAVAFVTGRRPDHHKILMAINTAGFVFVLLFAMFGFAEGKGKKQSNNNG